MYILITDLIINVLLSIPYLLLSGIDLLGIEFYFPDNMFEIIRDLTVGVNYVVPIARLTPIFLACLGLAVFKIYWAIVVRIKSFIPTMGS